MRENHIQSRFTHDGHVLYFRIHSVKIVSHSVKRKEIFSVLLIIPVDSSLRRFLLQASFQASTQYIQANQIFFADTDEECKTQIRVAQPYR